MHRNWVVNKTNPEFLQYLSASASISPAFAQVLVSRGMNDAESIKNFLNPSFQDIHDPFLMPDMDKAVKRLKEAVDKNETVLVHGDYDADGITSTALLVSVFRRLGLKTCYHIPNRITEGYGLSSVGVQKGMDAGAGLIVTADCGISSEQEILNARSKGMDVIITDHHEPPEKLPEAVAVIDPHRKDSDYPYKYLAGVGVAFKLAQALFQESGVRSQESEVRKLLDLVALGTIADSVPLTGENRVFVIYGLKEINSPSCRIGVKAMKEVTGISGDVRAGRLSFTVIPRINAAGRLDDAGEVVELFLTHDEERAGAVAALLDGQNKKRKKIEGDVLKSALEMIDPHNLDSAIVLASHDWHPGVIGIVASRLVDMFFRPVFLFSIKDSIAKGSARSIPPLHLFESISECSELLLGFGGHRQAAGMRLSADNMNAFREKMNSIVDRSLKEEDMVPTLEIAAAIKLSDVSFNLVNELNLLEPFGESNREPVFGAKGIEILDRRVVGTNHLKMRLRQEKISFDTIGFSMADKFQKMESSSLDIAFVPNINEWKGSRNLQLNLKAFRPKS
ncbi:MAG: single-stranded-DNA-specific exonuclease RecJ [Nitrospirota bacterium]